jgi:hypothetical protein
MPQPLNRIELAILGAMSEHCVNANLLQTQIDAAAVSDRTNTGAGFYTELQTPSSAQPVPEKVIGNVFAKVVGCVNPMTFVLFLKDGYIRTLEGAAVEDSTVGIDFSSVGFDIMPAASDREM